MVVSNTLVMATIIFATAIVVKGILEYVSAKEQVKVTRDIMDKVVVNHGNQIANKIAESVVQQMNTEIITRGGNNG